jgi:nicotinate-nucleotide--dimethylbenzimidazole phosphoribosyltransferase
MITPHQVWAHLDALAKPQRSLGLLEQLAVELALTQQRLDPVTRPRRIVLFAADHGVVRSGVSAWPSEITGLMVGAILAGRAASAALARAQDCDLRLVDVGVASPPPGPHPENYRSSPIAPGTADLAHGPAMSLAQFDAAWAVGADEAKRAAAEGGAVLIAGEMGIGNTTAAACLTALLTRIPVERAVGRGAGATDEVLRRKAAIVAEAVSRARLLAQDDLRQAIASVAGFEIAAMAGYFATGAALGATLLLDGYVATAAALIAEALAPGAAHAMIAAHKSAEPGHGGALAHLGLAPLLDWDMRLGEGTGALTALPLLDSAAALLSDVARLSELGV